jgi:hypothetical protein
MLELLPSGVCAEIGVASGDFSYNILRHNKPQMLHLIDSWENFDLGYHDGNMVSQEMHDKRYDYVCQRFINYENVKIHRGRSVDIMYTFPDNYFDWVYIDADHSYKGCLNDLIAVEPKMKTSGLICGHDFLAPDFDRAGFGVNEAVETFMREFDFNLIFLSQEKEYKSYVLSRKNISIIN